MKIICPTNLPLFLPSSSLFSFAAAVVVWCLVVFIACEHLSENVSTFACLCVHRNQAEPSEHNNLSAVEQRRKMGTVFSVQGAEPFFLLIAAHAVGAFR